MLNLFFNLCYLSLMKFNKTIKIALVISGIILLILTYAVISTYYGDKDQKVEDTQPTKSVQYQDNKPEPKKDEKPENLKKDDQPKPEKEVETDQKATEKAEVEKPKTQPKPATVPSYKPYVAPTPEPMPASTKVEETKTEARFAPEAWVNLNKIDKPVVAENKVESETVEQVKEVEPVSNTEQDNNENESDVGSKSSTYQESMNALGYTLGTCSDLFKLGYRGFEKGSANYTLERDLEDGVEDGVACKLPVDFTPGTCQQLRDEGINLPADGITLGDANFLPSRDYNRNGRACELVYDDFDSNGKYVGGFVVGSCKVLKNKYGLGNFAPGDTNYTNLRDGNNDGIACEM